MAKKQNFPKMLFVSYDENSNEGWLLSTETKETHAEIGKTKEIAEYRLVRVAKVRGTVSEV